MLIVVAQSVTAGAEAFGTLGEVKVLPDRKITRNDLLDADALIIRSKTVVNAALLEGTRVRYVGTATAGFDHLDTAWLDRAGIAWNPAAGCNANSVAEYVMAALLILHRRHGLPLSGKTLGVIGVGQVGRRVAHKARALGLRVLENDPPRQERELEHPFTSVADLLPQSDYVTLHVPLTDDGPHATRGMVDDAWLARVRPGAVFLNASRGEVVREDALRRALDAGRVTRPVLDVWDHEPDIDPALLARAELATPHIAGYSFDGKLAGTEIIYRDGCRALGRTPVWRYAGRPAPRELPLAAAGKTTEAIAHEAVRAMYDLEADDRALRAPPPGVTLGAHFEALRKGYPKRLEFANARVVLNPPHSEAARLLDAFGFAVG